MFVDGDGGVNDGDGVVYDGDWGVSDGDSYDLMVILVFVVVMVN